jgi:hypothetical protein
MEILKSYFVSKIRSNMLFKDFNKKNLSFLSVRNDGEESQIGKHRLKKSINLVNLN